MSIVVVGIDLGKNSCSIVGLDAGGAVVVRRRMRRDGVIAFAAKLAPCTMAMEACCGAHHKGRMLAELGHEIRLMSPEYVRSYVKAQKMTTAMPKRSERRRHAPRCALLNSKARSNSTSRRCIGCATACRDLLEQIAEQTARIDERPQKAHRLSRASAAMFGHRILRMLYRAGG